MLAFVADFGGTQIKLALTRDQSILVRRNLPARADEGLAPQLPRIVAEFGSMCRAAQVAPSECAAFAAGFPSVVDPRTGRILDAYGKYEDAPGIDLAHWSSETLGLPLCIENDARLALIGEWKAGAGRGSDNLVMVTLGTGLGTAALIEGKVIHGTHGQAGIMGGHFTVSQKGRLCSCGNRGCAEAEASTAVLRALAMEMREYSGSALRHEDAVDFATVFRLARAGDPCATALRARAIAIWSSLIVNLIHAYDPERVILGGGIMAGSREFFSELQGSVLSCAHTPWGRVSLVPAELGDAAALLGGEHLILQKVSQG